MNKPVEKALEEKIIFINSCSCYSLLLLLLIISYILSVNLLDPLMKF